MRPLRIAVDAHRLVCEPLTSGGTYLEALVREWQYIDNSPELDLLVPFRPPTDFAARAPYNSPTVKLVYPATPANPTARYREQLLWQQRVIPGLLRQCRPDVYFSPFHLTPQLPLGLNMVTAIHDLCFLGEPFFEVGSLVHRAQVYSARLRARRLICVSQFTADVLAHWSPRAARKATVVHNGIVGRLLSLDEAKACVRALSEQLLGEPYLLWIGHPTPRKNPELLFDVFASLHQRFPRFKFVVVAPETAHQQLQSLAMARNITPQLMLFSRIDSKTRDALYRCALALVFPSRCEGFGFPILEAMWQGCPAFAARKGPTRELVGDLLPTATSLTVESFMTAMGPFLAMSEPERQPLKNQLCERAGNFSSKKMAAETLKVLRSACPPEV